MFCIYGRKRGRWRICVILERKSALFFDAVRSSLSLLQPLISLFFTSDRLLHAVWKVNPFNRRWIDERWWPVKVTPTKRKGAEVR